MLEFARFYKGVASFPGRCDERLLIQRRVVTLEHRSERVILFVLSSESNPRGRVRFGTREVRLHTLVCRPTASPAALSSVKKISAIVLATKCHPLEHPDLRGLLSGIVDFALPWSHSVAEI